MLQPLIARYNGLISRPDLKNVYNDHKFRHQLVSIMECFIGCVQGSHMVTCSQLYNILQPVSNIKLKNQFDGIFFREIDLLFEFTMMIFFGLDFSKFLTCSLVYNSMSAIC